jgi:superfamily II DNA or RNA helicase
MASTVLGRRGYVIRKECLEADDLQRIREDLTFTNGDEFSTFGAPAEKFPVYAENTSKIYIPRYYGLEHYGEPEIVDFTEPIPEKGLIVNKPFTFVGTLRDYQEEAIQKLFKQFGTVGSGGIICMPCGFGKTRTTIYAIYKLKNMFVSKKKHFKAIIVVHKEFLGNQWRQNIAELIPEAKIGTIQADNVDIDGKDIVIAMLQSISMKDYPDSMFNRFDFAIFDECHHLAAMVFSKALLRVGCKYLLGLSATPNRADGCHDIFHMSIGPIVYKIERKVEDRALVHKIVINSNNGDHYKETFNKFTGNKQLPNMINDLCLFHDRNELIVNIMRKILEFEDGRKIILLSSRRDNKHLGFIKEILDANPITKKNGQTATYGYYMGRQGESKKKYSANISISENADIILATLDISKEGLDVKGLNTLLYATPIKGLEFKKVRGKVIECQTTIEQSIGRILREPPEFRKLIPLVIDIVDNFSNFTKWCYTRNAFYKKVGYPMTRNVITLNVDKHKKQKYNLDFLTNYEMFYADPAKIKEVTEGIEREDSSLSSDSRVDGCMIDDD